jgi:hypothetical protein
MKSYLENGIASTAVAGLFTSLVTVAQATSYQLAIIKHARNYKERTTKRSRRYCNQKQVVRRYDLSIHKKDIKGGG